MNNLCLNEYIKEFETFCKKRKIEYKREDRGVVIKNANGAYNIHLYMKWDNYNKTIIGFMIGNSIYEISNKTRYENNLGFISDMSIVRSYLQDNYPKWLTINRDWKSRSKYK